MQRYRLRRKLNPKLHKKRNAPFGASGQRCYLQRCYVVQIYNVFMENAIENRKKERIIVYIDGFNLYFGMLEAGYDYCK
jgi:hypothetical protein